MKSNGQRSGWGLALAGLLGLVFFWLTDPQFGPVHGLRSAENVIDASRQAILGTLVGMVGSLLVLLMGLWLMVRRMM